MEEGLVMKWTLGVLAQDGGGGDSGEGIMASLTFSCFQNDVPDSPEAMLSVPASFQFGSHYPHITESPTAKIGRAHV